MSLSFDEFILKIDFLLAKQFTKWLQHDDLSALGSVSKAANAKVKYWMTNNDIKQFLSPSPEFLRYESTWPKKFIESPGLRVLSVEDMRMTDSGRWHLFKSAGHPTIPHTFLFNLSEKDKKEMTPFLITHSSFCEKTRMVGAHEEGESVSFYVWSGKNTPLVRITEQGLDHAFICPVLECEGLVAFHKTNQLHLLMVMENPSNPEKQNIEHAQLLPEGILNDHHNWSGNLEGQYQIAISPNERCVVLYGTIFAS